MGSVRLLAVVGLPLALGHLHLREHSGKGRVLRRAGVKAEADGAAAFAQMADAHLAEIGPVLGAFQPVVVPAAERSCLPQ